MNVEGGGTKVQLVTSEVHISLKERNFFVLKAPSWKNCPSGGSLKTKTQVKLAIRS